MANVRPLLDVKPGRRARMAIFLSGSGSNAERILERVRARAPDVSFEVAALVTDAPETSRARELGLLFELPVIENDIRVFYRQRGEKRVSIATPRGQEIRQEWTDNLREQLAPCEVDFAVFAGFVPLTNLTADFPCLNVHPGDLTHLKDGRRHLVGLHTVPVERAILEGLDELRSSVIMALPYTGNGDDMDNGPILGISPPVPIVLGEETLEDLARNMADRPDRRPKGGFADPLERLAEAHQDRLKEGGDWIVFPRVTFDFAAGRFGIDDAEQLYYRLGTKWHPIKTVVYGDEDREIIFASPPAE